MRIEDNDTNFVVKTNLPIESIAFYDVRKAPFEVCGVIHENGSFRRMPEDIAKMVSPNTQAMHPHASGGRVRFKTDSPYIAIHAKMGSIGRMRHFALTGSAGFDLYLRENGQQTYLASYMPALDTEKTIELSQNVGNNGLREYIINMPLYSRVNELYIGLDKDAVIEPPEPYTIEKPVVFYGTSITQGGCASRPGNCYQGFISRELDCNYINLGFSGGGLGENEIAEYIKGLDMSVFVYDYDYNAPNVEHLEKTHEKMFLTIRKANPNLPIVMMSRPKIRLSEEEKQRICVIRRTYENALAAGDKNVYFIYGPDLMAVAKNNGTVDGVHLNDLGFFSMAQKVSEVLRTIFDKQ